MTQTDPRNATLDTMIQRLFAVVADIDDALPTITDSTERSVLLNVQRETQNQIDQLVSVFSLTMIDGNIVTIPIVIRFEDTPWESAWQRAWPEHERMASSYDHQVVLKMSNQWLIVNNVTNIREPKESELVYIVSIATVAEDGSISFITGKGLLSESQVFAFFLNCGYGISDESAWRATLADAEHSWSDAWATADEWNATHEEIWRCNQIQAETTCCDGKKTTMLCVNRRSDGLFEPGYYTGGNVMVVKDPIPEAEIAGWYDQRDIDFSFDLAWELVTAK